MDPSSTRHLPTQAQKPSPNDKADQLPVTRTKTLKLAAPAFLSTDHEEAAASVPTQSANTAGPPASPAAEETPISSKGEPARLEVDKWFGLENSTLDTFKPALYIFKHISTTFPIAPVETAIEPPPLIVQVLLSLPQPLPSDQILILNHGGHQICIENSPRHILLESWRVDITRCIPESHNVRSSTSASPSLSASDSSSFEDLNIPATYKQCVAFFRSLYTLLRILPAWRLRRQLRDTEAGLGGGMTLEMSPTIGGTVIVDFDHALSEQHLSANGVQGMALPSVPSPLGDLSRSKSWQYGQLLRGGNAEDKEDGATTEDELQLTGEINDGSEDANGGETASEDELGEWDTVPAPPSASPSPNGSPSQSQRLAREREDSPFSSADDLEAFMAAEQSMKARSKPGYVEPEAPGDDEDVIFLGYSTGQEDVGTSDADERGEIGENELQENPDEEAQDQEEELLGLCGLAASYDLPSEPSSDSDSEPSRLTEHDSRSSSKKEPRHPPRPPSPNRSPSKPAKPSKDANRAIGSSSEGLNSSPTKSKSDLSLSTKAVPRTKGSSSSTTLTPTLNRLMRDSTAEIRRTPSRHPIPEAAIPVYRGTSSFPTNTSQTEQPSPKKQTKASSQSLASKPRTPFTPLSDSEDDVPLMSRRSSLLRRRTVRSPSTSRSSLTRRTFQHVAKLAVAHETRAEVAHRNPNVTKRLAQILEMGKEKGKAETKKRKRDSVEEVQVETQLVERMGSLGLEDGDDEIQEGNARQRATAAWQRTFSVERPVRHSTPPRADPVPQNPPQALQMAPPPVPQPPVPQLQQQALPTPQLMQPSGYPSFYYPTGFPYMQMQMPVRTQVPMAMPMSMAPQFHYPPPVSPATFIPTPPVPVPQPQSFQQQQAGTPNASHETLLTQVLYTLNYLTHQNGGNSPGNPQQQPAPGVTHVAQKDSDGFAIPLLPETPQQEWRVEATGIAVWSKWVCLRDIAVLATTHSW
ncbi:hypothetical protein M407DRAFT_218008 [Tulasnella calospora MUT 4182]|uniref:Autophagy-related protein 13 n=1 Tax=Tulasnella calospora MUT 4182 TaxID=1051891 RepID=A0A0C3Q0R9_9AGAM|nr:hypothetical protein M407DRAFT_218008 [Tulasnella calospora MUT 4182]